MATGLFDIFQTLFSCTVDICGNGVLRGGKGAMMAGARKIGWASGSGGDARSGKRFAGHRMSRKSLASGRGRATGAEYDPRQRTVGSYSKAMKSGTGLGGPVSQSGPPPKLFGRSSFRPNKSPLGRGTAPSSSRFQRSHPAGKNPRSFIKY